MRADVGSLPIEFRGIVRHGKIDLQDASISNAVGVERYPDRLCMAGASHAHSFVLRALLLASGVTGNRVDDARDMLEHALNAPEAPAREDRLLGRFAHVDKHATAAWEHWGPRD